MFIYFLRHASAGQRLTSAKKDEKRGLDKEGIEQCGYIGRGLAALGVQVEVILSSPLKRSSQTASLVGNEMGHEGKLLLENALRPESTFSDFQKMLGKYARLDSILLVGHNPNLREFLGRVISESGCEASFRIAELVPYPADPAYASCCGRRERATEDFAEIDAFFFDRPQLQVH